MPTINSTTSSTAKAGSCQRRIRQPDRRGSLYLSVVGVAMIVSAIGMSALVVARLNLRSVSGRQDRREARILADAAVELGAGMVMQDTAWRTSLLDSQEYPSTPFTMGNGTIAWKLVDEDGDLADDLGDAVRLYGIGRVGQSVYTKSVLLEPSGTGLTCLEVALHSGGDITLGNSFDTNQTISSNDDVRVQGPTVNTNVEAVNTISGSINGTQTQGITPRQLPGSSVFDYYLTNGTRIDFTSIPSRKISRVVVSPGNNPYGPTLNPLGIYVIDCQGGYLEIEDARIHGTLVILNPASGSRIDRDIHWEPAVANYPALLVQGDITMIWHAEHTLRESQFGINYNPAHSPYQDVSDSDTTDEYRGVIKGLIYVSGNLVVDHDCLVEGAVVVGGRTTTNVATTLNYSSTFLNNPPPGFGSGNVMQLSPGSWRRELSE